jgi:TctA family transporter
MDLINNLSLGFSVAFTAQNLMYAFIGCLLGTLIGVLPGIGPVATIAMLLPATYALPPVAALIMLAGIYYGAQYGGSTTAILVNLPGESSSVVTVIDGYQMARKGRAGPALAAAGWVRFCRLRGHPDFGRFCCAADRSGLQVRPGRVFFADDFGPDRRSGAGLRLAASRRWA